MIRYKGDQPIASADEEWIRRHDESPNSQLNDTRDRRVEVRVPAGIQNLQLQRKRTRGHLHVMDNCIGTRKSGVHEHADHAGIWNQLMQQLQALSLQRSAELADACDVAAWSVEAGNEAELDRVNATGEDDWKRRGRCPGCESCRRRAGDD